MTPSNRPKLPRELRHVVRHARRFRDVLATLEAQPRGRRWVVGRSGELQAWVSVALSDWKRGAALDQSVAAIRSYVDELHRAAAAATGSGPVFDCCGPDDFITARGEGAAGAEAHVLDAERSVITSRAVSTVREKWVDSPEVLARFRAELGRVEALARSVRSSMGSCADLDDLCAYGREGLLEAARSFDEARGVPFALWATQRMRGAMLDVVRRWNRDMRRLELGPRMDHDFASELGEAQARSPYERIAGTAPQDDGVRMEMVWRLRHLLGTMPALERQLVEARYFEGLTVERAGERVGVDKARASRLLSRALVRLRSACNERWSTQS